MRRRDMLLAAMGATLAGIHLPAARAQGNWPDRPVRLIVPFPPAWCTDQGCGRTDPEPRRDQARRT
jgi:tripartite-type tricarboxylate transporter receptor subunit TctC